MKPLMRTPREISIAITGKCNLRCDYCYHFDGTSHTQAELPKEEWLAFFKELKRSAVLKVTIGGGEPFVRQDLLELIDGIVANNMRFSILTNGTLVTDADAAHIAKTKYCDHIQISLDGHSAESHDACRGKGNFHKAIKGIRFFQRHGIHVTVRVTITRYNVGHLDQIAQFLLEEMNIPFISTNAASYQGLCKDHSDSVQLTIEERQIAMESLMGLRARYPKRIVSAAGPLSEARRWSKMEELRKTNAPSPPGGGCLSGCGCIFMKLAVRADGMVTPCSLLTHMPLGRINQVDLEETWLRHPELNRLRDRSNTRLESFEFCKGCEYIDFCTGNCPSLAHTYFGTDHHPSPDACYRLYLDSGGKRL